MIYIERESTDPCFWFGLENYLMQSQTLDDDVFLLWRVKPTLMLGRYQNAAAEIDEAYAKKRGVLTTRRVTGGGAIYADLGSWQFSFIKRGRGRQIDFVEFVLPVLDALRRMGFDAVMSGRNDLTIGGKKFCGNAQYRLGGRVLHHGSVLFQTDLEEMESCLTVDNEKFISKGVSSLRQRVTNLKGHLSGNIGSAEFGERLSRLLTAGAKRQALAPADVEAIEQTYAPLFRGWDWVYGKSPDFQVKSAKRLAGGRVEVEKGVITDCVIGGDFFFAGDICAITERLRGCRYDRDSVYAALSDVMKRQPFYMINLDALVSCIV